MAPGSAVGDMDVGGFCVDLAFCREAHEAGIDVTCIYSDISEATAPPPATACPPQPHPTAGFCGGECGSCTVDEWPGGLLASASCAGVNADRGFGVCAFMGDLPCFEGDLSPYTNERCRESLFADDCACLLLRGPDGELPEVGFTTVRSACLAYRERFPGGDVECYDQEAWTRLP